jgi:hypothetical protein
MRRSLTLLVAAAALLLSAPVAFAGADSFTITEKGVTESFTDVLPCVSDSADITITYNSIFHITELDNGSYHVSGTLTGTFTAVGDGVTYTRPLHAVVRREREQPEQRRNHDVLSARHKR